MVRHRETICPLRCESRCDRESKLQGVLGAGVHPPTKVNLPTFDGHPRRGALREVMVKILPQEDLATRLSQVEVRVSFQGIWEMFPNSTTCHPCARTLVSPMWSVWTVSEAS